jgi:hypothetical protein
VVAVSDYDIYLLENLGDGTGALAPPVLVSTSAYGVVAAHFDSDECLDLLAFSSHGYGQDIMILPGTGSGSFDSPIILASLKGSYPSTVADFDWDGRMDMVTSTGIWPGVETGTYSFTISPVDPFVNLDRSQDFDFLILNPTVSPGTISMAASSGSFELSYGSAWNRYTAPAVMPAEGSSVTITATEGATGDSVSTTVTLTEIEFSAALPSAVWAMEIAFDPVDPGVLYVGTDVGEVYRSDFGSSVEMLGSSLGNDIMQIGVTQNSTGSPVLLAMTHDGLFRYDLTVGTAGTWESSIAEPMSRYTPFAVVNGSGLVFAFSGELSSRGFYSSLDGGESWAAMTLPSWLTLDYYSAVWAIDADRLYVSYEVDDVKRLAYSGDGGATWSNRSSGWNMGQMGNIKGFDWDPADPDRLIVAFFEAPRGEGDVILRSDDGGLS